MRETTARQTCTGASTTPGPKRSIGTWISAIAVLSVAATNLTAADQAVAQAAAASPSQPTPSTQGAAPAAGKPADAPKPAAAAKPGGPPPATVGVARVDMRQAADTRPVIGQLVAAIEAQIATRTPGIISEVRFAIGDVVRRDQVLVKLDTADLQLERASAEADVEVALAGQAVAEVELRLADQGFQRQAALRSSGAFSKSRFEDLEQERAKARAELNRSRAAVTRSRAAIALIDYRLAHSEIKAPFDGVVIERQAQPGSYMNVGTAVATLIDVVNMEVEADIPVELVTGLQVGLNVELNLEDGETTLATVRAIVPVQSVSTRTRPVRFSVDLSRLDARRLARGKSVVLALPASDPKPQLTVPKDALVQAGPGWSVFVVRDGKAMPAPVQIGASVGDRVVVESGVDDGDTVVVRGNERLRPGQAVQAAPGPGGKGSDDPPAGAPKT